MVNPRDIAGEHKKKKKKERKTMHTARVVTPGICCFHVMMTMMGGKMITVMTLIEMMMMKN